MQKLTRQDLGLDVIAYKDYLNNLREFAEINKDLNAFALESLSIDKAVEERELLTVELQSRYSKDQSFGAKRVANHRESISFTLAKLQRTGSGYLNDRDRAACKELKEHMETYMLNDSRIFDQLSILEKHR